jgi:hypothetical protein
MLRPRLGRLSLLLLLGFALAGCEYDEPGQQGRQPTATPDWSITDAVDEVSPDNDAIPCGDARSVHLSLAQTVPNCAGYNFSVLYARAKALVDARVAQIVCPEGCTIRQTYYTHWSWNCAGTKATVNVKAKLRCLEAEAALPPNVGDGSGLNKTAAVTASAPGQGGAIAPAPPANPVPPTKGESIVIDANAPQGAPIVPCNTKVLLSLTYRQKTPNGGPPLMGYESYVDTAKTRARLLYNSFACQPPCTKRPFRALFTSWSLSGADVVVVRVFFEVDCKP